MRTGGSCRDFHCVLSFKARCYSSLSPKAGRSLVGLWIFETSVPPSLPVRCFPITSSLPVPNSTERIITPCLPERCEVCYEVCFNGPENTVIAPAIGRTEVTPFLSCLNFLERGSSTLV